MFGFGSIGASFPMRYGAPNSRQVDYLPDFNEWQTDFDARMAAAQEAAIAPTMQESYQTVQLAPGSAGYDSNLNTQAFMRPYQEQALISQFQPQTDADMRGLAAVQEAAQKYGVAISGGAGTGPTLGYDAYNPLNMQRNSQSGASHTVRVPTMQMSAGWDGGVGELNAERDRMMPRFETQTANQQAYNWMRGQGQDNGVMGPDYANPGFGRIDGNPTNPFAPSDGAGVGMDWASGFYDPQAAGAGPETGTYNPQATARNYWGL